MQALMVMVVALSPAQPVVKPGFEVPTWQLRPFQQHEYFMRDLYRPYYIYPQYYYPPQQYIPIYPAYPPRPGMESPPQQVVPNPQLQKQGIDGKAEFWKGDFQPKKGGKIDGKILPWETKIFIFEGRIKTDEVLDRYRDKRLVAMVKTNKDGTFKVDLPPGTYTIFGLYDGKLYLNSADVKGWFTNVKVVPGKYQEVIIVNSAEITQ
jgi:hypothetical protein